MKGPPIWLLIDGNNHVHRDFHAAGIERVGPNFAARLELMIECWQPARVVCAFDAGESFRHRIEPKYKAGRKRPPEIADGIAAVQQVCLDQSVDVLAIEDFEADDIIATLAGQGLEAGHRIIVSSADKDLHQLIRDGEVLQLIACKRIGTKLGPTWRNEKGLFVQYGVKADQWVDYRIMTGDASDNLPGVHGIGPSTAAKILQACGSLDGFFCNPLAAPIGKTARVRLINAKPRIGRMRRLMTLRTDVPMPESWRAA